MNNVSKRGGVGNLAQPDNGKGSASTAETLKAFKKDKEVLKFMKKYRYQYHVTMLPDLATLARDAYLDGYWNGVGQHEVSNMVETDKGAK